MSHSKHQRWFSLLLVCFMLVQLAAPAVRPAVAQEDNTQRDTLPQSGSEPPHGESKPATIEESTPATPIPDPQLSEPSPPTVATPELPGASTESMEPSSPLSLGLTADQTTVSTGDTVRLTLSMTNSGNTNLSDFVVGIYLPPGLNLRSGSLTFDDEFRLAWTKPQNLAVGATKHIEVKVKIESGAPPNIVITAAPQSYKLDSPDQPELELTITDGVLKRGFTDEEVGGWAPQFVNPVVATFSGAATYEYPIEVPPGRNGLQPTINLSYNSKRVDGMLNWEGSEWVGLGWNIDVVDIVRTNVRYKFNTQWITYDDAFQLILNGTSYRLIPTTPGQRNGRYYADSAPDIYIERINDCNGDGNCSNNNGGSRVNKTTEYWIVKTSDGTTYRLGYEAQSEQVLFRTPNCDPSCDDAGSPYSGPVEHYSAYRWRVDLVSDVYGNEMKYEYVECLTNSNSCALYTSGPTSAREVNSYLNKVYYNKQGANWLTQIELVGANKSSSGGVDSPPIFKPRRKLTSIKILWDGGVVKEYDLEYDSYYTPSSGLVLLLTDIIPYGLGGLASGSSLPGPSFGYQKYANKDKCCPTELDNHTWANESFEYERLAWAENGYGGRVEFDYENDGRGDWWISFYNYRVSQKRVYDGLNAAATSIEDYDYGSPCYDQWNPVYGTVCTWPNNPDEIGPLAGHTWTEVTLTGANGVIQKTKHYFRTDSSANYVLRGRESQTDYMAPDSTLLQRDTNTFGINTGGVCEPTGLPASYRLACLREANTTVYDGANASSTMTKYWYDPSMQDGVQYGLATKTAQYSNGSLYRRTATKYDANTSNWVIVPRFSSLFDADWHPQAVTFNLYDGEMDPNDQTIDIGQLTMTRQRLIQPGVDCPTTEQTVDTVFSYDEYGNNVSATNYVGYGWLQCDSNDDWVAWSAAGGGSQGHSSVIVYDADGLLPVANVNPLGHITSIEYDDNLPWLPAAVTGPNSATTRYEYDDFGRLLSIYNPGSEIADVAYLYYDTSQYRPAFLNGSPLLVNIWRKSDPEVGSLYGNGVEWERLFYDGLGRLVQTQHPAEDWFQDPNAGHDIVQDFSYDAHGQQIRVSQPYPVTRYVYNGVNPVSPYNTPSPTVPSTETGYDALGRSVQITNPDGTKSSAVYSAQTITTMDPKGNSRTSTMDPFGRLNRVEEKLEQFSDSFSSLDACWTVSGYQSIENEILKSSGTGSNHDSTFYHTNYNLAAGEGIRVEFKVDQVNPWAIFALESGPNGTASYRRWSIGVGDAEIYVEYNDGNLDWQRLTDLIDPLEVDTWYILELKIQDDGIFVIDVWERDDPSNNGHYERSMGGSDWRFRHWIYRGTAYIDNYAEFNSYYTSYAYDELDNLVVVTDTNDITTTMNYDSLSRKIDMVDPDMGAWSYEYDAAGNLITQTDALSQTISFSYDDLNRLATKSSSAETLNSNSYHDAPLIDNFDSLQAIWNTNGTVIIPTVDPANANNNVVRMLGDGVAYNTHFLRSERSLVHGDGISVLFKTSAESPQAYLTVNAEGGKNFGVFVYNDAVRATYNDGSTHSGDTLVDDIQTNVWYAVRIFVNDVSGFLVDVRKLDDPSIGGSYQHDMETDREWRFQTVLKNAANVYLDDFQETNAETIGRQMTLDDLSGSTAWGYDVRGRVVTETKTIDGAGAYTTTYGYDAMDRVVEMTYPNGEVVTSTYNPQGLPENLSGWTNYLISADYNAMGQPTAWSLGNTLETNFDYNSLNSRLLQIQTGSLLELNYVYDPAGNVTTIQDDTRDETLSYDYDSLDRLVTFDMDSAFGQDDQRAYSYSPTGNITSKSYYSATTWLTDTYSYNANLQPHAVRSLSNGWSFDYDSNGNMTTRSDGSGAYLQEFDVENRLVAITNTLTLSVTRFVYDGSGARVMTIEPDSSSTIFVGEHYEVEGSTTRSYYYLGGQRIAMRVDDGQSSDVFWFHSDHLGSTSTLSDITGNEVVTSTARFYPYGEYRVTPTSDLTDKGFTGHAQNDEVALIYMRARYYVPGIGRFASADTIVPDSESSQDLNRYTYVRNRPLICTDPSGHCELCRQAALTVLGTGASLFGNPLGEYRVVNFPEGHNMTTFLLEQMNVNAEGDIAHTLRDANYGNVATKYAAYLGWAALVRGGGPWDFKVELNAREIETIEIAGVEYKYDVLANVYYGYMGRASGFTTAELLAGAGLAQIAANTSDISFAMSFFDDPADQAAIWVGMFLWEKYGQYGQEITEDMLLEALYLYDDDLNKPEQ